MIIGFASAVTSCRLAEGTKVENSSFMVRQDTVLVVTCDSSVLSCYDYSVQIYKDSYLFCLEDTAFRVTMDMKQFIPFSGAGSRNGLFVRNDTLWCSPLYEYDMREIAYYNPEDDKWEGITTSFPSHNRYRLELNMEDDQYKIYLHDRGEFGSYLCFEDKETGIRYWHNGGVERILCCRGVYYAIGPNCLFRIGNPKSGTVLPDDWNPNVWELPASPMERLVQLATPTADWNDTVFISGFVVEDELYTVINADSEIYVAKLQNNTLCRVCTLGIGYCHPNMGEFKLGINDYNDAALFGFRIPGLCQCGFIHIKGYDICKVRFKVL